MFTSYVLLFYTVLVLYMYAGSDVRSVRDEPGRGAGLAGGIDGSEGTAVGKALQHLHQVLRAGGHWRRHRGTGLDRDGGRLLAICIPSLSTVSHGSSALRSLKLLRIYLLLLLVKRNVGLYFWVHLDVQVMKKSHAWR